MKPHGDAASSTVGLLRYHSTLVLCCLALGWPLPACAFDVDADINKDDPELTEHLHQGLIGSPFQPIAPATGRKIGVKMPVTGSGNIKVGYFNERTIAEMPGGIRFTVVVNGLSFLQNVLSGSLGIGFNIGHARAHSSAFGPVGSGAVADMVLQIPIPGTGGVTVKLIRRALVTTGSPPLFGNSASLGVTGSFGSGSREAQGSSSGTGKKK